MKQLSGVDASFLNMETPTQFGHVNSITIVDPSTMRRGTSVYAELIRTIEERLHLVDIYRRKLVEDPFRLDNPYWVDDPDLDLEFHIREIALPAPGDERQLAEQVARLAARPLDRSRPLWEWYVISGLEGGLVGLFMKLHHATIDGASGVELLHVLLDTDPAGRVVDPPTEPWQPEPTPTSLELLGRALWSYARRPQKAIEYQARLLRETARLTGSPALRELSSTWLPTSWPWWPSRDTKDDGARLVRRAPPTPFNRAITAHRRFAFCTLKLSDAQAVKRALGVTVNDVVMAMCASALRQYLVEHEALPDSPLIAMVPVSVRTGDESDVYTNRVTAAMCSLHTDLADPFERVMAIHESMKAAKELQRAIPADLLTDVTQFTPPVLAGLAARLGSMVRIADRMRPPFNVIISNVPGPRQPLYLSGAVVKHYYPVSGVAEGLGLNMTVQSYLDNLDFGLVACRELVPDLWDLCDLLPGSLAELSPATATPKPARRRASAAKKQAAGRGGATGGEVRKASTRRPARSAGR
jgi:diacylglycerol O-acyltransferase / wax synthase